MNTLVIKKTAKDRAVAIFLAIVGGVLLPQVFHYIGVVSGLGGANVGGTFLPMHIPVLLAGLFGGPVVGLAAGLLSPVVSYMISGMPAIALLPFMMIEIAGYGLIVGFLAEKEIPTVVKVAAALVAGRLFRALALFAGISLFALKGSVMSVVNATVMGIPGILIQLVLVPLIVYRVKK